MARKDGGYRLPSELNPARKCIMLEIPKNREHMIAFTGALQELTKWWNWQRDDNKTGLAAALVWQDVLSQLVGQIDYADPEIWEGCTLPPNFRLTEACELQYTNDNGETWNTVSGWPEFSECFTGPAGPEGPEGPEGPAGPTGPTGPTGVVTAQLVRVDGDTPPDFYYTPQTQTLTAVLQEQWFRGIRTRPVEWLFDTSEAQAIELQTYDNPDDWVHLVTIPPAVMYTDPSPAPIPDSEIACGMATNLMARLYANWEQSVEELGQAGDITEAVAEFIEIFYGTLAAIPFQAVVDGITSAFTVGQSVLESTFTPQNYDDLLEQLYCRFLAAGRFDGSVMADWWQWIFDNYPPHLNAGVWWFALQTSWTNIQFMKRHALIGSLSPSQACQFFNCPSPPQPIEYYQTFDDMADPPYDPPDGITIHTGNSGGGNPYPGILSLAPNNHAVIDIEVSFSERGITESMAMDLMLSENGSAADYEVAFIRDNQVVSVVSGTLDAVQWGYEFYRRSITYTPIEVDAIRLKLQILYSISWYIQFDNWEIS